MSPPERSSEEALPKSRRTSVSKHLLSGQLTVLMFSLAVNVLSARAMGPGGRGRLALLLQMSYILGAISLGGCDRSYPATRREVPRLGGALRNLRGLVLPVASAGVVVCVGAGAALMLWDRQVLPYAVALAALSVANLLVTTWRTAAIASGSGRSYLLVNCAGQGLLVAFATALALTGTASALTWAFVYALCLGVPAVASMTFVIIRSGRSKLVGQGEGDLAKARRTGFRMLPAVVASMVMLRADRLLLPWLASYDELGVYVVVATMTEIAIWPLQSFVDANIPAWHRAHHGQTLRKKRIIGMSVIYAAVSAAALLIVGRVILVPVFGREYGDGVAVLLPLAIGAAFYAVSRAAVGLALACENTKVPTLTDVSAMVVSVLLYVALIPTMGALGAAYGSMAGYGVAAVVSVVFSARRAGSRTAGSTSGSASR